MEASLVGTREIGFTVISITLSLVAVFAPMVFGHNMFVMLVREFSVTLTAAIVVNAVVSLTITPALCAHFLRRRVPGETQGFSRIGRSLEHFDEFSFVGIALQTPFWEAVRKCGLAKSTARAHGKGD